MFFDLALVFDPDTRRCDLALGDDCDLLIDETPVTAMLMSVGLERRAAPDDELPEGRSAFLAPVSFSERRGCPGDALDPFGDLTGCRTWLLDRAKETETTRQLYRFWLDEGLGWVARETGTAAEVEVEWREGARLAYRVRIADATLSLSRRLDA
ncbi:phage GP46 family protein [Shinella pollutisoli]|uniref:Phage GP46 family protein n=1 Tax=Shinella pollutisoli TaxID=2250594 RepID=A0ABV7DJB0_9HYPH|nr:phage GP46 family protein [Shinella pollutisoli]